MMIKDLNEIIDDEYAEAVDKQVGGNHYQNFMIQPVEFIVKNDISFLEGNVIKYVCRHREKNGVEDLNKAIHYLELAKDLYYGSE